MNQIKSNPIEKWLSGLEQLGLIDKEKINSILKVDNNKLQRLEKLNKEMGLPIIKYFNLDGNDFNESNQELMNFLKSDDLFAFRAVPKTDKSLGHARQHSITKDECISSIKELPGGPEEYNLALNGFFRTEYGGSIISNGQKVFLELVKGDHFKLSQHDLPEDKIFKVLKLPGKEIVFSSEDEIMKEMALRALKFIQNLPGYFEFLYNHKKGYVFIEYSDTDFYKNLQRFEIQGLVSGNVACPGRVEGEVSTTSNFKEGNILVTKVLTPDSIPLMAKAKAIVTDLGGATSHAAIIIREMGIPCIMGTKKATEIFKDGDLILVDGEKGIVRKQNNTQDETEN